MQPVLTIRSFTPLPLPALSGEARVRLKAARLWVMLARQHRSPRATLAALLGDAAPGFSLLMEELVSVWPDPFTTYPPCAIAVSPDEAALLGLLTCASDDDRAGAEDLFADLLPADQRLRLWEAAARAVSC